jgi:hypothetical protein
MRSIDVHAHLTPQCFWRLHHLLPVRLSSTLFAGCLSTNAANYNSVHKYTDQRIAADAARLASVSGSVPISRLMAIVSLSAHLCRAESFPVRDIGLQAMVAYPVGHIS